MASKDQVQSIGFRTNKSSMVHIVCQCDMSVALCGRNLGTDRNDFLEVEVDCVMCEYMDQFTCSRCDSD